MSRDIDAVIAEVSAAHPGMKVDQLKPSHPADDHGIWYFSHPAGVGEVQVESSNGSAPFLIEGDKHPPLPNQSVAETIAAVPRLLQL